LAGINIIAGRRGFGSNSFDMDSSKPQAENSLELHELPHAKIIKHNDQIAEVIVNAGIDYDMEMVEIYERWIADNMDDPCYVMVNRINSYSLSFEAQQALGKIKQIKAIALVTYTRASALSSQASKRQWTQLNPLDCEIFDSPHKAMQWLEGLRDTANDG
jgi:hypothetical protein